MGEGKDKKQLHIENHNCNVNIFQAGSCPTIHQSTADTKHFSVDVEPSLSLPKDTACDCSSDAAGDTPTAAQKHAMEVMNGVVADRPLLEKFIGSLSTCCSALDVGVQVVNLILEKPTISIAQIVKKTFVESMMVFAENVRSGRSLSNIQKKINAQYREAKEKNLVK